MGEIIFKTELIKGAKGDRGEVGQTDSIPTDGVIAFQGETVPDGYEETDPGDVFDEVYEDINAVEDMISDEYDTTTTYNAGDFCIHENGLYKCTATATGLWDGSKWVLTSAGDETKANASAIDAIVNVNGCCNVMPNNASTTTVHGATLTINTDKTVTIERATPDGSWVIFKLSDNVLIKAGTYTLTSLYSGSEKDDVCLVITDMSDATLAKNEGVESIEYTFASDTAVRFYITIKPNAAISTPITFKPMLYDSRLNPSGYVPYSMTNRELTEKTAIKHIDLLSTNGYEIWEFFGLLVIILKDYSGNTLPIQTITYGICSFYDATNKQNVHCNFVDNGIDLSNVTVSNESDTPVSTYHMYGSCIIEGHLY